MSWAFAARPAAAVEVLVTPAGGAAVRGEIHSLAIDQVVLRCGDETVALDAQQLPRLTPVGRGRRTTQATAGEATGRIWLSDGSTAPITSIGPAHSAEAIAVQLPKALTESNDPIPLSLDAVRALRMPTAPGGLDAGWEKIRRRPTANDLIVVPRRESATLDYVEGVLESIDEETLTVLLGQEPVTVKRSRVYGVVLANNPHTVPFKGPAVTLFGGAVIHASHLEYNESSGEMLVESRTGLKVEIPIEQLVAIDYAVGRVEHLGTLQPITTRFDPLFGTPRGVQTAAARAAFRVDAAYWGGPLLIRTATSLEDPSAPDQEFRRGLALRSGSELVYELDGSHERLLATAGVDPRASGPRRLRLMIELDGETVLDEMVAHDSPPLEIDLPLAKTRRLRLRVERVEGLDASLHLGAARLTR